MLKFDPELLVLLGGFELDDPELDDPPVLVVDDPFEPELLDDPELDPELDDPEPELLDDPELLDPELDVLGGLELDDPEPEVELPRLYPKNGTLSI